MGLLGVWRLDAGCAAGLGRGPLDAPRRDAHRNSPDAAHPADRLDACYRRSADPLGADQLSTRTAAFPGDRRNRLPVGRRLMDDGTFALAQYGASAGIVGCMVGLAVSAPFCWIAPIYAPPALLPPSTPLPNPLQARFEQGIVLAGYRLEAETVRPGESVDLILFWRAEQRPDQNYSVFIHLTDEVGILQAQRDAQPGLGNLPAKRWTPGMIISDPHRIAIPMAAYAPARLRIDVGLYDATSGRRLRIGAADFLTLGYVDLLPHAF